MKIVTNMMVDISQAIKKDLDKLTPHLKEWAVAHLVEPRIVTLFKTFDYNELEDYWLITDHTRNNDSSYRVVCSKNELKFGLEMETEEGKHVMMGLYGDFATTVESI